MIFDKKIEIISSTLSLLAWGVNLVKYIKILIWDLEIAIHI